MARKLLCGEKILIKTENKGVKAVLMSLMLKRMLNIM